MIIPPPLPVYLTYFQKSSYNNMKFLSYSLALVGPFLFYNWVFLTYHRDSSLFWPQVFFLWKLFSMNYLLIFPWRKIELISWINSLHGSSFLCSNSPSWICPNLNFYQFALLKTFIFRYGKWDLHFGAHCCMLTYLRTLQNHFLKKLLSLQSRRCSFPNLLY